MKGIRRYAQLALVLAAAAGAAVDDAPKLRLPDAVAPLRYRLDLTLTPPDEAYKGTVEIDVAVKREISAVWLHARDLTVRSATVSGVAAEAVQSGSFLVLSTGAAIEPGEKRLRIDFTGKLSKRSSDGLFLNLDKNHWYVLSQFEPISARAAFPCFDEPAFKTPWHLTLHIPEDQHAFSNTPQASEKREKGGLKRVEFTESRPLPSYLVALAVGPWDVVDAGTAGKNKTPLRIITPRGRASEAAFAAHATAQIVEQLEEYFGIPYPYAKLDSVAVPMAFGFGAMENAGLITYAQHLLLATPAETSLRFQREYTQVAAHEIAHQWFGNLVTLAWWDDVWLNEAFASWIERRLLERWQPDWHAEMDAAADELDAMNADSLASSRVIRQPIASEHDIGNSFDAITYQKGASVIRMFESWVGAEPFRKGVRRYLDSHAYGSATAASFLADIGASTGRDIAPAFQTFLNQTGTPLVSVRLDCGEGGATAELSQKRYAPLGARPQSAQTWSIPIVLRVPSGTQTALLTQPTERVALKGGCPAWISANADQRGYYRVQYRGDLMGHLLERISTVPAAERLGLAGDAHALMQSGDLPAADLLRLIITLGRDPDRHVVRATIDSIKEIGETLVPAYLEPTWRRFILAVYGARARELGWQPKPSDDGDTQLLRPALVGLAARQGGDPALIEEAARLARRWLSDRKAIAPGVVDAVLEAATQSKDATLYEAFRAAARVSTEPRDRRRLLGAMAAFRDPALVQKSLNLLLTGEFDMREKLVFLIGPLDHAATRALPFAFVQQRYNELVPLLPSGVGSDAGGALPVVARKFCDAGSRAEVEAFFKDRVGKFSGGPRTLALTLERIDVCTAVKKVQAASVAEFLKASAP